MQIIVSDLYCYVCKVAIPSNWRLKRHKETDKHRSYVEFYSVVESNAPPVCVTVSCVQIVSLGISFLLQRMAIWLLKQG